MSTEVLTERRTMDLTHPAPAQAHANPFVTRIGPFGVDLGTFGMWLFLASEVMFFTGLLATYLIYRVANPDLFTLQAHQFLDWRVGGLNTLLLITSSYTMVLAVRACGRGEQANLRKWLLTTAGLGALFIVLKLALEYVPKFMHGHTPSYNLFFSCYYALTGVHALHVIGGVVPLVLLAFMAARLAHKRSRQVEIMGLYWHFVDVVWIFLFPLLYLVD